jgi:hypothetical protein
MTDLNPESDDLSKEAHLADCQRMLDELDVQEKEQARLLRDDPEFMKYAQYFPGEWYQQAREMVRALMEAVERND